MPISSITAVQMVLRTGLQTTLQPHGAMHQSSASATASALTSQRHSTGDDGPNGL